MLRSVIPCTTAGCSWQLGSRRGAQYHARERAGPFALPQLAEMQLPVNVHFKPKGSEALANQVTASLAAALAREK